MPRKRTSIVLHYFPAEISLWLQKAQLSGPEAAWCQFFACLHSWNNALTGGQPGALPDDDATIKRIVDSRSKRCVGYVRQIFTPSDVKGVLVCPWLAKLYEEKHAVASSYSTRGRGGGRPRKPKKESSGFQKRKAEGNHEGISSGGGVATQLPPPPERAPIASAGHGDAAAASSSREDHPAYAWLRGESRRLQEVERRTDQVMAERWHGHERKPSYPAVRARVFDEQVIAAFKASPEGILAAALSQASAGGITDPRSALHTHELQAHTPTP